MVSWFQKKKKEQVLARFCFFSCFGGGRIAAATIQRFLLPHSPSTLRWIMALKRPLSALIASLPNATRQRRTTCNLSTTTEKTRKRRFPLRQVIRRQRTKTDRWRFRRVQKKLSRRRSRYRLARRRRGRRGRGRTRIQLVTILFWQILTLFRQSIQTHNSKLAVVGEFQHRRFHMTVELAETTSRAFSKTTCIADRLLNLAVNMRSCSLDNRRLVIGEYYFSIRAWTKGRPRPRDARGC